VLELFRYRKFGTSAHRAEYGVGEDATAFVNLRLEAGAQRPCPIYVADFLGDCAQFFGLPEAINKGQYLVPRMSRDERRAAIAMPALVGGAEIAPVLLTRLGNDIGDNPDQLSILQHALNRTWANWAEQTGGKGPLDLAHYEAIGTMAHALDAHAEEAYAALGSETRKALCEKLFKALTDKGMDIRGVRRPTQLGTLCELAEATEAEIDPDRIVTVSSSGELKSWPFFGDVTALVSFARDHIPFHGDGRLTLSAEDRCKIAPPDDSACKPKLEQI
jgi:hypothetical protein